MSSDSLAVNGDVPQRGPAAVKPPPGVNLIQSTAVEQGLGLDGFKGNGITSSIDSFRNLGK